MKTIINEENNNERVDVFVAQVEQDLSRAEIQRLIKSGDILVNGEKTKASYRLLANDRVSINPIEPEVLEIIPKPYPIEVIYEDDDVIVINKPQGIVVYPGAGKEGDSVVSALLFNKVKLFEAADPMRPGIVHRLDKDTSGLMVLSKSEVAHEKLMLAFKEREVVRKYVTLVDGVMQHNFGTIDAPVGRDDSNRTRMKVINDGRSAKTFFTVLERGQHSTLVEAELYTGRTHQIRVHMQYIKHSIIGDPIYRKKTQIKADQLMLQSYKVEFMHPTRNIEMKFELPIRADFKEVMERDHYEK